MIAFLVVFHIFSSRSFIDKLPNCELQICFTLLINHAKREKWSEKSNSLDKFPYRKSFETRRTTHFSQNFFGMRFLLKTPNSDVSKCGALTFIGNKQTTNRLTFQRRRRIVVHEKSIIRRLVEWNIKREFLICPSWIVAKPSRRWTQKFHLGIRSPRLFSLLFLFSYFISKQLDEALRRVLFMKLEKSETAIKRKFKASFHDI